MSDPRVYLVGIGISPWSWTSSLPLMRTNSTTHQVALSAATKALLDAGVSYDDIDLAIGCGDLRDDNEVFYTFGKTGIPVHEVDNGSGLYAADHFIKGGSARSVLLIGIEQDAAVGIVLCSDAFLWRHPYLKDTAAVISGCALGTPMNGSRTVKSVVQEAVRQAEIGLSNLQIIQRDAKSGFDDLDLPGNIQTWLANTSLAGLSDIMWLLRGWKSSDSASKTQNCLQCTTAPNGTVTAMILSRADGQAAPSSKEVEHKNDGRGRLGYNPAIETKDIAMEDWESVKSRDEFSDARAADKVRFRRKGGDRAALAKL